MRNHAISIHAPRTGSDYTWCKIQFVRGYFNPRSPHGERLSVCARRYCTAIFQSTLPARGATKASINSRLSELISIHAPRTGSDTIIDYQSAGFTISIHAPRTGSDTGQLATELGNVISIHAPRTGSDSAPPQYYSNVPISIHAPRTGSDTTSSMQRYHMWTFQSTLPARGATLSQDTSFHAPPLFQSTLPARGATSHPFLFYKR